MSKRVTKKKLKSTWAIRILLLSLFIFIVGLSSIVSYKFGYAEAESIAINKQAQVQLKQKKLLAKITKIAKPKNDLIGRLHKVLEKEQHKVEVNPQHEFDSNILGHPPKGPKRVVKKKKIYSHFNKPKLAIIMDDVSFAHDVKAIKALGFPITMSFLPPSPVHPDSAKLASHEKVYMVHLPLEAMTFSAEEPNTLRATDSKGVIVKRVKQLKALFPRTYFVNNHTGSKFTSNKRAINDLIIALQKEGIGFLDSRTTAETKVPEVMASLGKPYIARDIFLDHESDVKYIEKQILKAVAKAKKHGSAIAICHPRRDTLKALKNSKKVLEKVDLVLVNKLI